MLWNNEGPYKGKYIGKEMTEEIRKQPFLLIELFFRLTNKDFVTVPFFTMKYRLISWKNTFV